MKIARAAPAKTGRERQAPPTRASSGDWSAGLEERESFANAEPAPGIAVQRSCACGGSCPRCAVGKAEVAPKVKVGEPGDPQEREADRAALQVLAMAAPRPTPATPAVPTSSASPTVRRLALSPPSAAAAGPTSSPGHTSVTPGTRAAGSAPGQGNPSITHGTSAALASDLESEEKSTSPAPAGPAWSAPPDPPTPPADPGTNYARGASAPAPPPDASLLTTGGMPLPASLRAFFEARFGRDLSAVRLHQGPTSEALNDRFESHAFTFAAHVWLGRGQVPAPGFLLAHELAHVVQQSRPAALPIVRRAGLGEALPFWVPLGAKGALGGSAIHADLLGIAKANNTGELDIEAPAPNADATDWGLKLQGSIDLYRGGKGGGFHVMPGIAWDGPKGAQDADVQAASPMNHRRSNKAGRAAGQFKPWEENGSIQDIAGAPDKVEMGELKPAAAPMLSNGAIQLGNYQKGLADAARLVNDWANLNGVTDRWNPKASLLPDAAVKFIDKGKDLKFDPANPRDDKNLVLAYVKELSGAGAKYSVDIRFNPAEHGLDPIKGGLYAQLFQPGTGLWMYFARPKDLSATLALARSDLIKGEMTLANQVQDEVLDPLFQAPKQVAPLSRARTGETPKVPLLPPPLPSPAAEAAVVRRAPKKGKADPKLEDTFKFPDWQTKQRALRGKIHGPNPDKTQKKKLAGLQLLEEAYKADKVLSDPKVGIKAQLPDKAQDKVKIMGGKGKDRKERSQRDLGDLSSWLRGWTAKPVEVLGRFRSKFGLTFVKVAEKMSTLKERIREKFQKAFESRSTAGKGTTKAAMVAKALGKAVVQVAKVLIPQVIRLVLSTLVSGIEKQLRKLFDIDPLELIKDELEKRFEPEIAAVEAYEKQAKDYVEDTIKEFTADFPWIKDLDTLAKVLGPLVEAATIAAQCGTPPGWGCLKILAKPLQDCAIHAVLQNCEIQKLIATEVAAVQFLRNLPANMAQKIMGFLLKAAGSDSPPWLKEILGEKVPGSGAFDAKEVECETSPPHPGCPDIGLPFAGSVPSDDHKAMQKMQEEFGEGKMGGLSKMSEAAGMPDDAPFNANDAKEISDQLRKVSGLTGKDLEDMAEGKAPPDIQAKLKDLKDLLEKKAGKAVKDKLLDDLQKGRLDVHLQEMAAKKIRFRILKPYKPGPFKNYPAILWDESFEAVGVADGEYGACTADGRVPLTITRADMANRQGQTIKVTGLPHHIPDARLKGHACPPPPPPPPPQGGQGGKGAQGGAGSSGGTGGGKGQGEEEKKGGQGKGGTSGKGAGKSGGAPGEPEKDGGGGANGGKGGAAGGGQDISVDAEDRPPVSGAEEGGEGGGGGEQEPGKPPPSGGETPEGGGEKPPKKEEPKGGPEIGSPEEKDKGTERRPEVGGQRKGLFVSGRCTLLLDCDWETMNVMFEELGGEADGWQVFPRNLLFDPLGTLSMLDPPNPASNLELVQNGDLFDLLVVENGSKRVVGKCRPSPVSADMVELISGEAFDDMQAALRSFRATERMRQTARSNRIHFK